MRRLILTRKDRLTDFNEITSLDFINRVNDAAVDIEDETFAKDTVLIITWDGRKRIKEVISGGISTQEEYYNVVIEALINPEGWEGFLLDRGKKEREEQWNPRTQLPADVAMREINDDKGYPDPGPHLLNGFGQRLIDPDGNAVATNADAVYINTTLTTDRGVYIRYLYHKLATLNPTMRLDQQP